jgi:hypothetical protein
MSSGVDNLETSVLLSMVDEQEQPGNFEDSLIEDLAQERLMASIDTKTGAPANVRAAVSAAQTEDDRLATLKNFYPDALPVQALDPEYGIAKFGYGNFVYTNPDTGQLTLFDEDLRLFGMSVPGLRDLVDIGPEIAETAGAIGGAIGGATLGAPAGPVGVASGIMVGEGLGSAAAREAYIGILDYFGETEDNRTASERISDIGTTAAVNAIAGPVLNKGLQMVKTVGGYPIRRMTGAMTKEADVALKNMETIGITNPSAGMVTANPTVNLIEEALSALPTSTKIMHQNAAQVVNQIDNFSKELAEKYGGIRTTSEAAEELMDGARKARVRYDNQVTALYNNVNQFIPPTLTSNADNTVEFINKYFSQTKTATGKDAVDPALRMAEKVVRDAKDGVLTYKQLKEFRTSLGHDLRSAQSAGAKLDAPGQKIKELYGYVTKDLDALVKQAGEEATEAYDEAVAFVKANTGKAGGLTYLDNVINKGEARATDALNYVLRGSKDGGEDLLKLRQMLNEDEYNVLSGYMLGRMGLPTPGVAAASELGETALREGSEYIAEQGFSPRTFVTNWNKLSKEAKEALFKNTEHADLIPELDALVTTVDRIGVAASQMANPSGTARVLNASALFGPAALGGAMAGGYGAFEYGLGGLIAPYMSAKLLTNKQFVRWLTEGVEKAAYDPMSFGQHVRRLYQIYELNPDIREEVRAITEGLTGDTIEQIPTQTSKSAPPVTTAAPNERAFREVTNPEIAGKLLPDTNLASQIDSFTLPSVTESTMELAMSPTVVPDERDREIAMREAGGIGSLV